MKMQSQKKKWRQPLLDLTQHKGKKQQSKSERNYKEALSIVRDNPDVFNNNDVTSLVTAWFGTAVTEILDKDADVLRCGVGTKPGATCIKDECLVVELCVHKDRKPVPKDAPVKSDAKSKSRGTITKLVSSNGLGIKVKI